MDAALERARRARADVVIAVPVQLEVTAKAGDPSRKVPADRRSLGPQAGRGGQHAVLRLAIIRQLGDEEQRLVPALMAPAAHE